MPTYFNPNLDTFAYTRKGDPDVEFNKNLVFELTTKTGFTCHDNHTQMDTNIGLGSDSIALQQDVCRTHANTGPNSYGVFIGNSSVKDFSEGRLASFFDPEKNHLAQLYTHTGQGFLALPHLLDSNSVISPKYYDWGQGILARAVDYKSFLYIKQQGFLAVDVAIHPDTQKPVALIVRHCLLEDKDKYVEIKHPMCIAGTDAWFNSQHEGLLKGGRVEGFDVASVVDEAIGFIDDSDSKTKSLLQDICNPFRDQSFVFDETPITSTQGLINALDAFHQRGWDAYEESWIKAYDEAGKLWWPHGNVRNEFIDFGKLDTFKSFNQDFNSFKSFHHMMPLLKLLQQKNSSNELVFKIFQVAQRLQHINAPEEAISSHLSSVVALPYAEEQVDHILSRLNQQDQFGESAVYSFAFEKNIMTVPHKCLLDWCMMSSHDKKQASPYYQKIMNQVSRDHYHICASLMLSRLDHVLNLSSDEAQKSKVLQAVAQLLDEYERLNQVKEELPLPDSLTSLASILNKIDCGKESDIVKSLSDSVEHYQKTGNKAWWQKLGHILSRLKQKLFSALLNCDQGLVKRRRSAFHALRYAIQSSNVPSQARSRSGSQGSDASGVSSSSFFGCNHSPINPKHKPQFDSLIVGR